MIQIVDAQTQNKITVYIIQHGDVEIRKRYSEFDQLHAYLKDKYPAIIIPMIPSKTSLKQYAAHPNSAKFDPNVIQQRKRLLEKFLNRILAHQVLVEDDGVKQFLDPSAAPVFEIKGHKKRKSFSIGGQQLKNIDNKFVEYESYTTKLNSHYKLLHKLQKKVFRKYMDMTPDDAELGAVYNALALTEQHSPELQTVLQGLGQAVDRCQVSKINLCNDMQILCEEPLQEYKELTDEIKEILDFRIQEQADFESNTDQLSTKWSTLKQLEKVEEEQKRMQDAFQGVERSRPAANKSVIGNLTEKLNSMIDSDPDATRRHNIAKTKDTIAQVIYSYLVGTNKKLSRRLYCSNQREHTSRNAKI
eukprot:NODE_86_length_22075_cov_1.190253.p7 type:complete len:360 gc:universal NODE_86_length_22075_cov_1.190253:9761-10840(+)